MVKRGRVSCHGLRLSQTSAALYQCHPLCSRCSPHKTVDQAHYLLTIDQSSPSFPNLLQCFKTFGYLESSPATFLEQVNKTKYSPVLSFEAITSKNLFCYSLSASPKYCLIECECYSSFAVNGLQSFFSSCDGWRMIAFSQWFSGIQTFLVQ